MNINKENTNNEKSERMLKQICAQIYENALISKDDLGKILKYEDLIFSDFAASSDLKRRQGAYLEDMEPTIEDLIDMSEEANDDDDGDDSILFDFRNEDEVINTTNCGLCCMNFKETLSWILMGWRIYATSKEDNCHWHSKVIFGESDKIGCVVLESAKCLSVIHNRRFVEWNSLTADKQNIFLNDPAGEYFLFVSVVAEQFNWRDYFSIDTSDRGVYRRFLPNKWMKYMYSNGAMGVIYFEDLGCANLDRQREFTAILDGYFPPMRKLSPFTMMIAGADLSHKPTLLSKFSRLGGSYTPIYFDAK